MPILAERRARLAARSGMGAPPPRDAPVPGDDPPTVEPAAADGGAAGGNGPAPEPLFAVAAEQVHRLRDRVDLVRVRVADWRAELDGR